MRCLGHMLVNVWPGKWQEYGMLIANELPYTLGPTFWSLAPPHRTIRCGEGLAGMVAEVKTTPHLLLHLCNQDLRQMT